MQNFWKHLAVTFILGLSSTVVSAASIEGYWQSIDDKTGEKISVIEIRKKTSGEYSGKVVHRYPDQKGNLLTHCVKCRPPLTNLPIVGLEVTWGFKQSNTNPNIYTKGKLLDARNGKIYNGRATVSDDNKNLKMHGYIGITALGRSQIWVRVANKQGAKYDGS